MKMPVLRKKGDGSTELVELDINEVLYINIEDRTIVYHTAGEKYYQISKLGELEEHFYRFGFDLLDKTNLVNMNKIKYFDDTYGKVFFDEKPDRNSKYASVAAIQQRLRKHQIDRAIARNTDKSLVYTLRDSNTKNPLIRQVKEPGVE